MPDFKGKCDYCGVLAPYQSNRGYFCDKHWPIALNVDIGPVLSSRSYKNNEEYDRAIADLKQRVYDSIRNSEKLS